MKSINRRQFLKSTALAGTALACTGLMSRGLAQAQNPDLVVIKNGKPDEMVRKAIDHLGGMSRFVKKDQTVLIKPNIGWDRVPEQAANTNPEAVAEVVRLCLEAGAKTVRVLDRTCNHPRRCYARSGIEAAAKKAGAQVRHIIESRFTETEIPEGQALDSWPIYRDVFDSDVFINMPIVKHHSISRVTLGFKNLMGIMGGDRGAIHRNFMTKIVDINTIIKPHLTIIDGYRVLLRNGPTGGNLDDVIEKKTIIAGTERVAADAYAVTLLDVDPAEMEYLKIAQERGLGSMDYKSVAFQEIDLTA